MIRSRNVCGHVGWHVTKCLICQAEVRVGDQSDHLFFHLRLKTVKKREREKGEKNKKRTVEVWGRIGIFGVTGHTRHVAEASAVMLCAHSKDRA